MFLDTVEVKLKCTKSPDENVFHEAAPDPFQMKRVTSSTFCLRSVAMLGQSMKVKRFRNVRFRNSVCFVAVSDVLLPIKYGVACPN